MSPDRYAMPELTDGRALHLAHSALAFVLGTGTWSVFHEWMNEQSGIPPGQCDGVICRQYYRDVAKRIGDLATICPPDDLPAK